MINDFVRTLVEVVESTAEESFEIRLGHAIDGLADEAGELVGLAKRSKTLRKPYGVLKDVDMVNLYEELGDLIFYYGIALSAIGKKEGLEPVQVLEKIMEINRIKLSTRYKGLKFSPEASENRDKQLEREAISENV